MGSSRTQNCTSAPVPEPGTTMQLTLREIVEPARSPKPTVRGVPQWAAVTTTRGWIKVPVHPEPTKTVVGKPQVPTSVPPTMGSDCDATSDETSTQATNINRDSAPIEFRVILREVTSASGTGTSTSLTAPSFAGRC